jgi:hypothetical protein
MLKLTVHNSRSPDRNCVPSCGGPRDSRRGNIEAIVVMMNGIMELSMMSMVHMMTLIMV